MKLAQVFVMAAVRLALPARAAPQPFSEFTNNVVFKPTADYTSWKTIYARSLQLPDGSILVTWENYPPEPPQAHFPIYKSTDGGATWLDFANVTDQVNGWGLRYQPLLYLLEEDFGGYRAGTILLAGMSLPADLSEAWLDLYASTDGGLAWEFVSHVVYAPGPETTTNGNKAVWEPFLLMHQGRLICYYSDQRDPAHAQKLSHVWTSDLRRWSDPVDDVAYSNYSARPGMPIVAHIESSNTFILTYELCGIADCLAHHKLASSPLSFGNASAIPILADGISPGASPYVIWTRDATKEDGSGVLILNGASRDELFLNDDMADPDTWKMVQLSQRSAHSRCLEIIREKNNCKRRLLVSGAGLMESGADNYVSVAVVDIPTL